MGTLRPRESRGPEGPAAHRAPVGARLCVVSPLAAVATCPPPRHSPVPYTAPLRSGTPCFTHILDTDPLSGHSRKHACCYTGFISECGGDARCGPRTRTAGRDSEEEVLAGRAENPGPGGGGSSPQGAVPAGHTVDATENQPSANTTGPTPTLGVLPLWCREREVKHRPERPVFRSVGTLRVRARARGAECLSL